MSRRLRAYLAAPRRGWQRTPLRLRLVAGVLVLVTLAMTLTGLVGTRLLRHYLLERVDQQLVEASASMHRGPPPRARRHGPSPFYVAVTGKQGRLYRVAVPYQSSSAPRLRRDMVMRATPGQPFTVADSGGSGPDWRVIATPRLAPDGSTFDVVVATRLGEVDATVAHLVVIDVGVGTLVLLTLAVAGYLLVRVSLRPLVEMEETAEAIAGGDLSRRVAQHPSGTEIGRLEHALNGMLAQIEGAFAERERSATQAREAAEEMRRFVADASHELRTPLTSIRGFAELYRQRDGESPGELMRRIEEAAARMGVLVDDLLLLARLDQHRPLRRHPVDLLELAAEAVLDARAIDPGRSVELEPLGIDEGEHVVVAGDEHRLHQIIGNLLNNALTHTPAGVAVTVGVGIDRDRAEPRALLQVADEGPGLPAEQARHVFERFYRVDPARGRGKDGSGTGLGLSIVASLAAAHGGTVELRTASGAGAVFRVLLPLAEDDRPGGTQ